jgi:glucose/arabinose dehydrogenase
MKSVRVARAARRSLLTLLAATVLAGAAPAHAGLTLTPAFTGSVSLPMYVTAPPGDSHRLFIVTRTGAIRVAVDGVLQTTPFLTIPNVWTTGEAGLISMAFDPNYENQGSAGYGLFYVYYVHTPVGSESNGAIHIAEYDADPAKTPDVADPTGRDVLVIPHNDASNHYGGTLAFNPNDGLLYVGTGDGGGSDNQFGNAQATKKSLLGKLLRIDPHETLSAPYSIPAGNPFSDQPLCNPPSGTTDCPEILAWGLRNPFRWSFDRATGDIAIGDVGQNQEEEVDYVPQSGTLAGDDFGWPCKEGPLVYHSTDAGCAGSTFTDPVFAYSHSDPGLSGSIAITGGVVVRDPGLGSLVGRYLYADFYAGIVHSLQLATPAASGDRVETDLPRLINLVNFGEDADGHVYIVQLSTTANFSTPGTVQRLGCDATCDSGAGNGGTPSGGGTPPAGSGATPPPGDSGVPATGSDVPPIAHDISAPRLFIRAARRQDVLGRGRVVLAITCSEKCLTRTRATARGLRLRGSLERLAANRATRFTVRASARVVRALARRGVVTVTIHARDAAGNLATRHLRIGVLR